ncbi:MAG TPA: acyl-CoA dehydrogenase family protein, partial [Trebonia sp.]
MSIAITDEHRELAQTVSDFLSARGSRAAARALLEAESDQLPAFWSELGELGWLGLHLPEEHGGSGFGLPELVIVAEEMGRGIAPGPFIPTVMASAVIAAVGSPDAQAKLLPGLADGSVRGAVALGGDVSVADGIASGSAGVVLGGHLADVLVVGAGDDVAIVDCRSGGVSVEVPANIDPARRAARVSLDGAAAQVVPGGRQVLTDLARLLLAAEATGVARECV